MKGDLSKDERFMRDVVRWHAVVLPLEIAIC